MRGKFNDKHRLERVLLHPLDPVFVSVAPYVAEDPRALLIKNYSDANSTLLEYRSILNVSQLIRQRLPLEWDAQKRLLNIA